MEADKSRNSGRALWFRLPVFEGPLDLLLHLIKRNELDPQEVTARVVTEQFLEYLELMKELDLDRAGEYLVMAATLLLIKSFALLPHSENGSDGDEGEELRRDLINRLLEFQRYREAAEQLGERPLLGRDVFAPPGGSLAFDEPLPLRPVSLLELVDALRSVLKRAEASAPRVLLQRDISVASRIPFIRRALERVSRMNFASLFDDLGERRIIIATFLALLELIRRGEVSVVRNSADGCLWIGKGPLNAATSPHADSSADGNRAPEGDY